MAVQDEPMSLSSPFVRLCLVWPRWVGWGALLLAAWGPCAAAAPGGLGSALEAAWAHDPQAAALRQREVQTQAAQDLAHGWTPGPGAVSVSQLNDRLNQNQGRREWEVELSSPIWLPAQRSARQDEAQRRLDLTAARAAALRWQLAGQLRQRWWAVALARENQALARSRLESARALASTVKARFQKGDLARVDANLAQVEVLSAQSDLIAAEQAVQEAEAQFRALTSEVAPAVLSPELLMSPPSASWDGPSHPLLLQAQATVNWTQSRLAVVQASRRDAPEVALRWTNERTDAFEPYHQAVGVKVTVPLASDARSRQDGAEVRAELNQAEAEQALIQRQVQQEYVQAYQAWQLAQQQLALAQTRQSLSEDNGRLAQRAFDLGEADLPSLLRARTLQREADVAVKQQQVALELAVSRLLQAQGVLP